MKKNNFEGYRIVLTADQALMTNFSGLSFFGFGHCVPYRFVPQLFLEKALGSPIETDEEGRALTATYSLRKVEASLLNAGFESKQVIVTSPKKIQKVITSSTRIVGISVVDPLGKAPVSVALASLLGGGDSCTKVEFLDLVNKVKTLKKKYDFSIVVGGPGVWQLTQVKELLGIDVLFFGEAEITFPKLAHDIIEGKKSLPLVFGETPSTEEIPVIAKPSRLGAVQVTRGCPRKCQFCAPTTSKFRSIPLDKILSEAELNIRNGAKYIDLTSDDVLLYGANGIRVNHEAVIKLFSTIVEKYNVPVTFPHVSVASVRQDPHLVEKISVIAGFSSEHPIFPDVGLESGSSRIIAKYMAGKALPWTPQEWPETVIEATRIMNENNWYPCYTMMVGFPDEKEQDLAETLKLVNKLVDQNAKVWIFPLLSIPIRGTPLGNQSHPEMEFMPKTVWELFCLSWQQSLRFSHAMRDQLLSGVTNPITKRVTSRLFDAGIELLSKFFSHLEEDPQVLSQAMNIDVHGVTGIVTIARQLPRYIARAWVIE